jgi:hypothetical protein
MASRVIAAVRTVRLVHTKIRQGVSYADTDPATLRLPVTLSAVSLPTTALRLDTPLLPVA